MQLDTAIGMWQLLLTGDLAWPLLDQWWVATTGSWQPLAGCRVCSLCSAWVGCVAWLPWLPAPWLCGAYPQCAALLTCHTMCLLPSRFTHTATHRCEFLTQHHNRPISKDTWVQLLDFAKVRGSVAVSRCDSAL